MKNIFIFVVIIFIASATYSAPSPVGTWELYETEESTGVFTYPDDLGYTVQFEFADGGVFREYRNEAPYTSGTYSFFDTEFYGQLISTLVVTVDSSNKTYAYGISESSGLQLIYGTSQGGWPGHPTARYWEREEVVDAESMTWSSVKLLFH